MGLSVCEGQSFTVWAHRAACGLVESSRVVSLAGCYKQAFAIQHHSRKHRPIIPKNTNRQIRQWSMRFWAPSIEGLLLLLRSRRKNMAVSSSPICSPLHATNTSSLNLGSLSPKLIWVGPTSRPAITRTGLVVFARSTLLCCNLGFVLSLACLHSKNLMATFGFRPFCFLMWSIRIGRWVGEWGQERVAWTLWSRPCWFLVRCFS